MTTEPRCLGRKSAECMDCARRIDRSQATERTWWMVQPEPPPPAPDKKAIASALKCGEDVPGCRLVQGTRVEIK